MKYLRSTTLECTDIGYRELLKRVHYTHIFNFNIWECKSNKETTIWLSSMSEFKLLPWIKKRWKKYRHLFFLNVSKISLHFLFCKNPLVTAPQFENKGVHGTFVNLTWHSVNRASLEITSTVPFPKTFKTTLWKLESKHELRMKCVWACLQLVTINLSPFTSTRLGR